MNAQLTALSARRAEIATGSTDARNSRRINCALFAAGVAWLAAFTIPTHGQAADQPATESDRGKREWVFSLLPKSLQSQPRVDLNVITEMTDEGRKRPPVTPERPAYFAIAAGGFLAAGQGAAAGEKPPMVKDLEPVVLRSLARNGYLPARAPAHPPTLVLFYHWGSHTNQTEDPQAALRDAYVADLEAAVAVQDLSGAQSAVQALASLPPAGGPSAEEQLGYALADPVKRKDLLERAAIIGGTKFATELAKALADQAQYLQGVGGPSRVGFRSILGDMSTAFSDSFSPFGRFLRSNPQIEHLIEETFSSCYYVIVSAYDYQALTKGDRRLLWRTKMSVNSDGVAMKQTLPTLIVTAGQFFGRDMPEAATITKRLMRDGRVDIGDPVVIEFLDKSGPRDAPKDAPRQ